MKRSLILVSALCACGGGSSGPDALTSVRTVDCSTVTPNMTVTTAGLAYTPMTLSVPVNGVIQYMLPSQHNVSSSTPGLAVDFGKTMCLQFTAAGTFDYKCSVHGFMGTVTVQ